MRTTRKQLEAQLKTASDLGKFPQGPYPTPGQIMLDRNGYGYGIEVVLTTGGAVKELSPRGLTAAECSLWLDGFNTALDLAHLREHWNLPTA